MLGQYINAKDIHCPGFCVDAEMESTLMIFSDTDRLIINSYIPVVDSLSAYLGNCFEIVLHSLEDYEHAVIAIAHGEHTGRSVGAPITDLALSMLDALSKGGNADVYFNNSSQRGPLKSSTIAIRGENDRVIGLLCINMYLNSPLIDILASLNATQTPASFIGSTQETFAANVEQLVVTNLNAIRTAVLNDSDILPSNKNKTIIEGLERNGIFRLKNAVAIVAEHLDISRNTVYMHIRNYRKADSN